MKYPVIVMCIIALNACTHKQLKEFNKRKRGEYRSMCSESVCPSVGELEREAARRTIEEFGRDYSFDDYSGEYQILVMQTGCHIDSLKQFITSEQIEVLKEYYGY